MLLCNMKSRVVFYKFLINCCSSLLLSCRTYGRWGRWTHIGMECRRVETWQRLHDWKQFNWLTNHHHVRFWTRRSATWRVKWISIVTSHVLDSWSCTRDWNVENVCCNGDLLPIQESQSNQTWCRPWNVIGRKSSCARCHPMLTIYYVKKENNNQLTGPVTNSSWIKIACENHQQKIEGLNKLQEEAEN